MTINMELVLNKYFYSGFIRDFASCMAELESFIIHESWAQILFVSRLCRIPSATECPVWRADLLWRA